MTGPNKTRVDVHQDTLQMGGLLYEEDSSSPIEASDFGNEISLGKSAPEVLLLPSADAKNLFGVRINGDGGNNYDVVSNDATSTTGAN